MLSRIQWVCSSTVDLVQMTIGRNILSALQSSLIGNTIVGRLGFDTSFFIKYLLSGLTWMPLSNWEVQNPKSAFLYSQQGRWFLRCDLYYIIYSPSRSFELHLSNFFPKNFFKPACSAITLPQWRSRTNTKHPLPTLSSTPLIWAALAEGSSHLVPLPKSSLTGV